jgi:hypothetical protein
MNPLKYWNPDGFEISSYKYSLKERVNATYTTSGTDNTNLCTYTYNELGFRGDSIYKKGFKVMSLGCSITEGVGVNDDQTWPAQFTKLIPNGVNNNFGTGGRSNDFISRCLLTYYDIINPDLVLIMYTSPHRREVFTSDGGIEPYIPTNSWGYLKDTEEGRNIQHRQTELQNDNMDFVNWYKNHLLIKYFLESKKCNWLWNGWMGIPKEYNELIRFDGDYGNFIDKGVDGTHPGPNHNKTYAHKLHNLISENFPNYINNLPKNIENLI